MLDELNLFFNPESIAVVGASERPMTWGYMTARNAVESGFKGKIYLVNPRSRKLFGLEVYPNISSTPSNVDLALITTPLQSVQSVIEECGAAGVKAAVVVTSGFSEVGADGVKLQSRIGEAARSNGVRVVGPNCNSLFNASRNLNITSIPSRFIKPSPIAFISQSGYIGQGLTIWGSSRNLHFGKFVSTGNECDLTCIDFLEFLGDDDSVEAIMLYVEQLRDGRRFIDVARSLSGKKPLVVLKGGRTEAGGRAASSHTAALSGANSLYRAVFRQSGAIQTYTDREMLVTATALIELPRLRGSSIGIITVGGGYGVMLTDVISEEGLSVPEPPEGLSRKLRELLPELRVSVRNPIDIGATWPLDLKKAYDVAEALMSDRNFDGVVIHDLTDAIHFKQYYGVESNLEETKQIGELSALMRKYGKPLLLTSSIDRSESSVMRKLEAMGVRVYSVREAALMLRNLLRKNFTSSVYEF